LSDVRNFVRNFESDATKNSLAVTAIVATLLLTFLGAVAGTVPNLITVNALNLRMHRGTFLLRAMLRNMAELCQGEKHVSSCSEPWL
jgi:hypothetical protein